MVQHFKFSPFILFIQLILLIAAASATMAGQQEIISFPEPVLPLSKQIDWKLQATQNGLKCSIDINLPEPKQPERLQDKIVGEYTIEIDGMIMKREFFDKPKSKPEHVLSFATVANGEHVISLSVRDFNGKLYSQKRKFHLNTTPEIKAASQEKDGDIFDPEITFSFWGEQDANVGMVDMRLNERHLSSFALKKEQNKKPIRLSELTGKKLFMADFSPGNHLLMISAHGVNGSSTSHVLPVVVKARPPVISVKQKDKNSVEAIDFQFSPTSNEITGSVEIHFSQSVIISTHSKEVNFSISRADLLSALKKHNQEIEQSPFSLIISARAANQAENWQEILFQ